MAQSVIHRAETRGHARHGWLDTWHTFSFANYYDPQRMHFGVLRVLNDDIIDGGMGFGTHPHDNMEIITIPLSGDLAHKDSMGNGSTIRQNDVQVMSAGTGIFHSEFNANEDRMINLLQIWVFPNEQNVVPRYDQITFDPSQRINRLQQILSPEPGDEGVWIHQDAWFHLGKFDAGFQMSYVPKQKGNGVYVFVIEGCVTVEGQQLSKRDGAGFWEIESLSIRADETAEILVMDVPMEM